MNRSSPKVFCWLSVVLATISSLIGCAEKESLHNRRQLLIQLGIALSTYNEKNGSLPMPCIMSDHERIGSWRLCITPNAIGPPSSLPLASDIMNLPWDSDSEVVAEWRRFSHPSFCRDPKTYDTRIQAVVGSGSAMEANTPLNKLPNDAILIIEHPRRSHHWMAPIDFNLSELQGRDKETLDDVFGGSLDVLFADGSVWTLNSDTPVSVLLMFLHVKESQLSDRDELLSKYRLK